MSLGLPRIPIAVRSANLIKGTSLTEIRGIDPKKALAYTGYSEDERCVWVIASYTNYRDAWIKAASSGLVDSLSQIGYLDDVDHVLPRSWAMAMGLESWWLRLHPVNPHVNRSAGGGRERQVQRSLKPPQSGIVYANELQFLKLIGHPVGTTKSPESIVSSKR